MSPIKAALPCEMWSVEELQELQAVLLVARDAQFDDIYRETGDNRRLRHHLLRVSWSIDGWMV